MSAALTMFSNAAGGGAQGAAFATRAVTPPYTAKVTDNFISVDATGGSGTITTPAPLNGQMISIIKADGSANTVTVSGNLNGGGTITLRNRNDSVSLWSDGSVWYPFA